jgi:hypothetical protein
VPDQSGNVGTELFGINQRLEIGRHACPQQHVINSFRDLAFAERPR